MITDTQYAMQQLIWCVQNKFEIGETVTMFPTSTNGLEMPVDYYILGYSITAIGFRIDLYIVRKQVNVSSEFCASIDMLNDSIFLKNRVNNIGEKYNARI